MPITLQQLRNLKSFQTADDIEYFEMKLGKFTQDKKRGIKKLMRRFK